MTIRAVDHEFYVFLNAFKDFGATLRIFVCELPSLAIEFMVRKGGFEPPRLSAPPPQDGVSASSTTSAQG